MLRKWFLFLVAVIVLMSLSPVAASLHNFQVGATGEAGSIGNIGIRVEIRTRVYPLSPTDESDSFWVGNKLVNGAFIQLGYSIYHAGSYCVNAEYSVDLPFTCSRGYLAVNGSQAIWFWAYFPNRTQIHYYWGLGAIGSVGLNGTWHLYTISPSPSGNWSLLLDGQEVANVNFPVTNSSDGGDFIAEKTTQSTTRSALGPVEFRNLAYLKPDGWHMASELYAVVNCDSKSVRSNLNCGSFPYGVSLVGPNDVIVGSSRAQPEDGALLWNGNAATERRSSFDLSGVFVSATVVAVLIILLGSIVVLRKKLKLTRNKIT
jgi:hypothetical protein